MVCYGIFWSGQLVDEYVSAFSLALKKATGLKTTTESSHLEITKISPYSLRSKRFRSVLEQKETVEGDFREPKHERGEQEGKEGNACRQTPRF